MSRFPKPFEIAEDQFCTWHFAMGEAGLFALDCGHCVRRQLEGHKHRDLLKIMLTECVSLGDLVKATGSDFWEFFRDDIQTLKTIITRVTAKRRPHGGGLKLAQIHEFFLQAGIKGAFFELEELEKMIQRLEPHPEGELLLAITVVKNFWLAKNAAAALDEQKSLTEYFFPEAREDLVSEMLRKVRQTNSRISMTQHESLMLKALKQLQQAQSARRREEKQGGQRRKSKGA